MSHEEIELTIDRLGIHGEGIGKSEGLTFFVEGALPLEKVRAKVYQRRKNFGRAKMIEGLVLSPHRQMPSCAYFGKCGGCQLMHLHYSEQLAAKRQRVVDALERVGKIQNVQVLPCISSISKAAYRNKIQLVAKKSKLGFHSRNSHDFVEIQKCLIHCDLGDSVFKRIESLIQQFPVEDTLNGVVIRSSEVTRQVLVVFITQNGKFPWMMQLAEELMQSTAEVKGVVQEIEEGHFRTIKGQGWIEEKINGLLFKVSPGSFFQVNPKVAELVYQKVLEFAALTGHETVLDAYCGVGTLSLIFAQHAKEVIGIECIPEAISDAKHNAKRNGIANAVFHCALVEKFISEIKQVDVAILNPSRGGCDPLVLEKLAFLRPNRIIYVSCDPATLARDLRTLLDQGYSLGGVQPFDMFPQTAHVETVVCLNLSN